MPKIGDFVVCRFIGDHYFSGYIVKIIKSRKKIKVQLADGFIKTAYFEDIQE